MRNEGYRSGKMKKGGIDRTKGGRGRRPKLFHLIFVNICKELKCRDNRQDVRKKYMTFKFM